MNAHDTMRGTMRETMATLAAGARPAHGLLHSCRLQAFGTDHYGEEAIIDCFRRAPIAVGDEAVWIDGPGHLALFDGDIAVIADVFDGGIGRLWRLGPGEAHDRERGIDIAFDPDLSQARGDVFFAASDHPALAADAADIAIDIGRSIARDTAEDADDPPYRARAFTLRAFGTGDAGAVLFAVHRLSGGQPRRAGFSAVAVLWQGANRRTVRDRAADAAIAQAPWSPRIVP